MSDPLDGYPPAALFAMRDAIFNMTLMETFGDGIFSAIFWFTLYMLVFRKRDKGVRVGMSAFVIIIPLYMLAMIHLGIHWWLARLVFVVDADTPKDSLLAFITQPQWCNALSVVTFSLMSLIADIVTVWRCWVIWNRNWKVAIIPLSLVLVGVAFCIMSAIFQIDPASGLATSQFNKFANFSAVYFCLSLGSTVISTILIIYRIVGVARDTGFHLESTYRKALEIIVESAALYSIALVIFVPLLVRKDFSDAYPQAVLICITGIAPTLISARVSLGVSRDYSSINRTTTMDSNILVVAQTATAATGTSKTLNNDSSNELRSYDSKQKEEQSSYEVC
ncbi:hypothetical protein D9756_008569 [Leucocoprinus leucothites]|uniref:Uncharacterized protein n=1 Tax=Leucocoprinus leucothites TaxID=201217 RepID=A0A8H5CZF0_9AGAR|nr:hypothetical protein D9756_008569 [Leucoagaricus leucothites]